MEIVSKPAEEQVRDIDIMFMNGLRSLTLRAADSINYDSEDLIVIRFADPPEELTIFRRHVLCISVRPRTVKAGHTAVDKIVAELKAQAEERQLAKTARRVEASAVQDPLASE